MSDEGWEIVDVAGGSSHSQARRKRVKRGSLAERVCQQSLPKGPASVAELFDYPSGLLQSVFANSTFADRCVKLLSKGVAEHSDYSGVCAERESKRLLCQALGEDFGIHVPHVVTKTCDIDRICQQVLVHLSESQDSRGSCVFSDIRTQIHPEAQAYCSQHLPNDRATKEQSEASFKLIWDYLMANASWAVSQVGLLLVCVGAMV